MLPKEKFVVSYNFEPNLVHSFCGSLSIHLFDKFEKKKKKPWVQSNTSSSVFEGKTSFLGFMKIHVHIV
jgi:hypothetical protein